MRNTYSYNNLILRACSEHGIMKRNLLSRSRSFNIVKARASLAFILKTEYDETYQSIATLMNKKSHVTIINLLVIHEKLVIKDPLYQSKHNRISIKAGKVIAKERLEDMITYHKEQIALLDEEIKKLEEKEENGI